MSVQPSVNRSEFGPALIVQLYVDAVERWQENYEALAKTMAAPSLPLGKEVEAEEVHHSVPHGPGSLFFHKLVEAEMELCRFYEKRWSQYLELPEVVASCKSPMELAQLQTGFFSRFTADYAAEAWKLLGVFGEFLAPPSRY